MKPGEPHVRLFAYASRDHGATQDAKISHPNIINLAGGGHEEIGPDRYCPPHHRHAS